MIAMQHEQVTAFGNRLCRRDEALSAGLGGVLDGRELAADVLWIVGDQDVEGPVAPLGMLPGRQLGELFAADHEEPVDLPRPLGREQLQRATEFLQEVTRRGGKILFVGCKKQAQEAVKEAATACGQFYVNQRWLGGTLTNLATIRKSIGRLKYIEQIEESPDYKKMGKQELAALNREAAKLRRNLDGILEMSQLPDAMVVIDTTREANAVLEARRLGIPTVAIVDTNAPRRSNWDRI